MGARIYRERSTKGTSPMSDDEQNAILAVIEALKEIVKEAERLALWDKTGPAYYDAKRAISNYYEVFSDDS
jgi:hypothetical protein